MCARVLPWLTIDLAALRRRANLHSSLSISLHQSLPVLKLIVLRSDTTSHLPSLPLIRLSVLERKPTRPLIRACLPANSTVAARKQNAPERNRGEESGAQRT